MSVRRITDNSGLAKVVVQCSSDTFVVNQTFVLRNEQTGKTSRQPSLRKIKRDVLPMPLPTQKHTFNFAQTDKIY